MYDAFERGTKGVHSEFYYKWLGPWVEREYSRAE